MNENKQFEKRKYYDRNGRHIFFVLKKICRFYNF